MSGAQVLTPPTATSARPRSILVQSGWTGGRSRSTASPAPSVYRGTQSNDVTTSDFGDYASAYVIEGAAQGVGFKACGQLETMAVSTCSAGLTVLWARSGARGPIRQTVISAPPLGTRASLGLKGAK